MYLCGFEISEGKLTGKLFMAIYTIYKWGLCVKVISNKMCESCSTTVLQLWLVKAFIKGLQLWFTLHPRLRQVLIEGREVN